ncbi:uncharacterized protein LOC128958544 [Oppia nitens]|uniref:uncharacterized protein LOC128958544 n=1 Tax=Oppia nitens TaxID=1686743 RepID=UPI0023DA13F3|nr:uncharacterized protein LOC128958544 [Oppia nitens]
MFRFIVLALTISYVCAGGYGGDFGGLRGGDFGGLRGGYSGGLALGNGYGAARAVHQTGPITAAIQSTRSYEVVPVALVQEAPIPQTIDVGANFQPVNMIFRTASSPLNLEQVHTPFAPQFHSSKSEDEASVVTHENYKPIIQEYREVIQPYRKIEQRVQPVIENVHTVVSKGEEFRAPLALAAPYSAPLLKAAPALPLFAKPNYK